jgi:hypothetical protein
MRFAQVLAAVAVIAVRAPAADPPAPAAAKPPVNTVCPVDGNKVDAKIPPIAGKTKEGKTVMIATCSEADAATVREHPDQYADDAVANRKHGGQAK